MKKSVKPRDEYKSAVNEVRGALRKIFKQSSMFQATWKRNRVEEIRLKSNGEPSKVPKVLYKCEICECLKPQSSEGKSNFHVDHIVPIGSGVLKTLHDVPLFYSKLFNPGNLQLLCVECHTLKTKQDRKDMKLDLNF